MKQAPAERMARIKDGLPALPLVCRSRPAPSLLLLWA